MGPRLTIRTDVPEMLEALLPADDACDAGRERDPPRLTPLPEGGEVAPRAIDGRSQVQVIDTGAGLSESLARGVANIARASPRSTAAMRASCSRRIPAGA
jgi:hypothetical protein